MNVHVVMPICIDTRLRALTPTQDFTPVRLSFENLKIFQSWPTHLPTDPYSAALKKTEFVKIK